MTMTHEPVSQEQPGPTVDPVERARWSRNRWIGAVVLTLLAFAATWDAWSDILHIAQRDEEASHIFLVPIVAAWLVWVRRRRLLHMRPGGFWVGPAMIAVGWLASTLGEGRLWQSVWHLGAILITLGAFLTATGWPALRAFLPAVLVLIFLIPVPGRLRQQIAIPMQNTTAAVAASVFDLTDTNVQRSGNLLTINGVDVAVAEACNGLRMVFALMLVCYAFAFGNALRPYARILILAATPVVAIVANVIRLIPTVYVYGYLPTDTADLIHDISGWVMLFAAFFALMGLLKLLRWALLPVHQYTLAHD